jgi:hypothetical protein
MSDPTNDLLPCPFCGGKPVIFERKIAVSSEKPSFPLFWYDCPNRECGISFRLGEPSKDGARDKWNKRYTGVMIA